MTQIEEIAVDMDDVLVDFVGGLVAAIKLEHNVTITREQLEECGWDLHPLLDPIIGRSWWSWLRESEWLWARFPAVPGAIGSIDKLRRQGRYLELITSKPEWAEHNVWKWLGHYRPAFNRVTIVSPNERKIDLTTASLLIDDKPENCLDFISEGRNAILLSVPHNTKYTSSPRDPLNLLHRAKDWPDVLRTIERIEANGR